MGEVKLTEDRCRTCGRLAHIDDLDSKPEMENRPDPDGRTDWTYLECEFCYGPGFISNRPAGRLALDKEER